MTSTDGEQPVMVSIGECRCSGVPRPHPEDVVYLAPRPSMRLGLAANAAIGEATDGITLQVALGTVFIRYGVVSWNLTDEKGPVPVTPDAVEARLTWDAGGQEVADKAADLYTDAIVTPLVKRLSSSPEPGPTDGSTSPSPQSPSTPRNSSKPSSRSMPAVMT